MPNFETEILLVGFFDKWAITGFGETWNYMKLKGVIVISETR